MKSAFHHREPALHDKWNHVSPSMRVNEQQHSPDPPERLENFVRKQYPQESEYARYQWYRNEWFRRAKELDPGEAPLAIGIELVSSCNLKCPMCYTITEEFQSSVVGAQRMLPWPIVTAILDECAELGVLSVLFSWRGESSLYRSKLDGQVYDFADALAYARGKGLLEVSSLTNGQALKPELIERIVEARPNWLNFSIDGLGPTYNKIRTPRNTPDGYDAYAALEKTVRTLVQTREARGYDRPRLRSNTVYPPIASDPDAYFAAMRDMGIDWITVNEILDFRGSGVDGETLPDDAVLQDWMCQYPFQRLMISANGVIVPCTGAHNEEPDLVLGRYRGTQTKRVRDAEGQERAQDYPETSIREVWHSETLNRIRRLHADGRRKEIDGCRNCRHGAVKHGVEWLPEDWNLDEMKWQGRKFRNG